MKLHREVIRSSWLLLVLSGIGGVQAGEFQVNQVTAGVQGNPRISHDSSGGFVVAWNSEGQDGSGFGAFARRFDTYGGSLGGEFQVNQFTSGSQRYPSISHGSSGAFVVAWQSDSQDGSLYGVFAQRFDSDGSPLGTEFQVNQYTTNNQRFPAISQDLSGGFVVAWTSFGQDGSADGVFARRFDSSGGALGAEFQVNQYTSNFQDVPATSHDSSGGFLVAWTSDFQDGSGDGVFARRFDSSGGALGAEFQVNQYTAGHQSTGSAISHDSAGGFVVPWNSENQDGSGFGVFARRFDSSGGAVGTEFQVNQYTTSTQINPAISHDTLGSFVVTWVSSGQDGSSEGVFVRLFDSAGAAPSAEFQVNQYTTSVQRNPTISHGFSGSFVVTWMSSAQDGSGYGVFARRVSVPSVVTIDGLVLEGQSGSTNATFLVLLSEPPELGPLDLEYASADGTASAGTDYTSTSGMLSIFPGQTLGFFTASVLGDTLYEGDEAFWMNLSTTGIAHLVDSSALGVIFNDDDPPSLLISDLQITEGNSGTSMAQFSASISEASGLPARVDFSTSDGTATAGEDYASSSGTLIFPAMSTAPQHANVTVFGDTVFEPDESFFTNLMNPVDATIGVGSGRATILNDDGNFLIVTGPAVVGGSTVRRYSGQ